MPSSKKDEAKSSLRINLACTEYEVLHEIALSLHWKVSSSTEDTDSDVYWQDSHLTPADLSTFRAFQRVNHFPGMYSITRKDHLGRNLKSMKILYPAEYNFFPPTWVLPQHFSNFKKQFNAKKTKTFIVKPQASSQGRGIFLTRRLEEVPENCVVQRYLHRPFLIDGLKFDLRVYILITACDPLRVFIHREGLVRLATEQYVSPKGSNLSNLHMHLTNYAINKTHPAYTVKESGLFSGHKRSLKSFIEWLGSKGHDSAGLWRRICDMAVKTVCIVQPLLAHLYRASQASEPLNQICFQVIGLDVFLDYKLRPFLLEVNHSPSFHTDSELDYEVKFSVVSEALKLLGLASNNRAHYYSSLQSHILNRATKGLKEMREYCSQLKTEDWEKRAQTEKLAETGYLRIYPTESSGQYEAFMKAAREVWLCKGKSSRKATPLVQKKAVAKPPRGAAARYYSSGYSSAQSACKLPLLRPPGSFVTPKLFAFC